MKYILSFVSPENKTTLELGSGTGRLSYLMLKNNAKRVTLVDSSKKAVSLSKDLFKTEPPDSYTIVDSDIFDYSTDEKYDIVFSSGVIEHFKWKERFDIVHKHISLTSDVCVIIHPTNTLYNRIFSISPISVRIYGFFKPYSDDELNSYLKTIKKVKEFTNKRFYFFYSVPILHNNETLNKACEKTLLGRVLGGLTITYIKVKKGNGNPS
jgi:SAM-dependent methyltransferase